MTSTMMATKTKFAFHNHRRDLQIVEDNFFSWSNKHHYRTSTKDMGEKVLNIFHLLTYRHLLRERIMSFQVIKVTSQDPQAVSKSDKDSQRSPEKCLALNTLTQPHRCSPPLGE